ncbi:DUF4126 domain-containing protein [Corynebacterium breve]|uniref:DUF4126 domain-containing protein n=1 Tax=Corynebacterium breve TaxID=3049799 RepID=A0ABY8VGG9_9CORY|nr:DUF4126 domain-containing protein [Corynebacterium breve]WIM68197.1 DUF4126 domain-containing protein [Corynebacterium breve]
MTLMTAISLASAAGLNAYIPLLVFGLLARYSDLVVLPAGWEWLAHPILLGIVALLLIVELVADKIPAVDSVNDIIQTLIRPTSGGIMFGSSAAIDGTGEINWWAVAAGVAIALVVHLTKATTRPVVDAGTLGTGTVVVSSVGDAASLSLSVLGILAPILALILLVAVIAGAVWMVVKVRSRLA